MNKLALLSVFLALPLVAQTPEIPVALQAKFWKAQAQAQADSNAVNELQKKLSLSQANLTSVVKEVETACGKDFLPQIDVKGDPACVAAPKGNAVTPSVKK